ncbi:MAG: ABC transporter ATP-binding protein [Anaerolineae bacterium]
MDNYAITTDKLSRDFGALRALDGLSIRVPAGSIYGFLGPNGAGKTTTIRLLLGLLEPTSGAARVLGYDTRREADAVREHCGALLEHTGLYERLSAEDNLAYYGRIYRMVPAALTERIRELLTHFNLYDRRKERVGTWSHGMRQKLAIARALLHHPQLIFLDEPTNGLDPIASAEVRSDLASLAGSEGVTVFLTTHNLAEAEKLCREVAVIRQGKLLAQGTLAELRARQGSPRLTITGRGFTPGLLNALLARPEVAAVTQNDATLTLDLRQEADSAPLVSLLVAGGAAVSEVRRAESSLEELFLGLMEEEQA